MNSLSLALGPNADAAILRATAMLAGTTGRAAPCEEAGKGRMAITRLGDILLNRFEERGTTLWLLGTIFNDTPGWDNPGMPMDDGREAAHFLLNRYRAFGERFLDGVLGQFAVILHDAPTDTFIIAVDPFGGRGMFVVEGEGFTGFSTKLDTAAAMMGEALEMDRRQEDFFLVHGFYPHGGTVYAGIRAMGAGEMLIVSNGEPTKHMIAQPDWNAGQDPAAIAASLTSEADAVTELERLFFAALEAQLPARRQKIGVLLGGFDSALVAAAIARLGHEVITYSFRYADGSYNQPHTDTLAGHIGCEHRWIDIDRAMIEDGLEQFPHLFNQPTNWPNYVIQTLRVMEAMRADGIAYCYSGDGCDAAFLGYPGTYARARLIGKLPSLPDPLHKALLAATARPAIERRLGHPWRVSLGLLRAMGRPAHARDYLSFRIMDEATLRQLRPGQEVADLEPEIEALSRPHAALPGVRRTYLGKAAVSPNRSKMIASADATGIPILAPYMHPALKRFALALPLEMLRPESGGPATGKSVLAAMAIRSGLLPESVVNQPKMAAVDAPVDEWYAGPMRGRMLQFFEDLPFVTDTAYLNRLLDLKWAEAQFKERVMTDKVISHAASLLATYSRFASLARRDD